MLDLIGDRFLKLFLKGFCRPSKPGSTSEVGTLAESAAERMNQSDNPEKTETLEKTDECSKKLHHTGSLNEISAATQLPDGHQK